MVGLVEISSANSSNSSFLASAARWASVSAVPFLLKVLSPFSSVVSRKILGMVDFLAIAAIFARTSLIRTGLLYMKCQMPRIKSTKSYK